MTDGMRTMQTWIDGTHYVVRGDEVDEFFDRLAGGEDEKNVLEEVAEKPRQVDTDD